MDLIIVRYGVVGKLRVSRQSDPANWGGATSSPLPSVHEVCRCASISRLDAAAVVEKEVLHPIPIFFDLDWFGKDAVWPQSYSSTWDGDVAIRTLNRCVECFAWLEAFLALTSGRRDNACTSLELLGVAMFIIVFSSCVLCFDVCFGFRIHLRWSFRFRLKRGTFPQPPLKFQRQIQPTVHAYLFTWDCIHMPYSACGVNTILIHNSHNQVVQVWYWAPSRRKSLIPTYSRPSTSATAHIRSNQIPQFILKGLELLKMRGSNYIKLVEAWGCSLGWCKDTPVHISHAYWYSKSVYRSNGRENVTLSSGESASRRRISPPLLLGMGGVHAYQYQKSSQGMRWEVVLKRIQSPGNPSRGLEALRELIYQSITNPKTKSQSQKWRFQMRLTLLSVVAEVQDVS